MRTRNCSAENPHGASFCARRRNFVPVPIAKVLETEALLDELAA
jgi:hypothetical protein